MSGTMLLLLGVAAVFLGIVLLLAVFGTLGAERTGVSRSLAAVESMGSAPADMKAEAAGGSFSDRVSGPMIDRLTAWGRTLSPQGQTDAIRRRLDLAGNPVGWDTDRVLAWKSAGLIVGVLVGVAMSLAFGWSFWVLVGVTALLGALGFYLADAVLYQKAYTRRERIQRELPDALDMLVISVEAGLSFDAALSEVARNTEGPLAEEFFRVLQEMQIGRTRSEAIRAMGDRTDLPELKSFATAMVQADAFGIPIANVLRVQAKEMRTKRSQRAEEAAQKLPVKMIFPLIFCILPVLFIVILGPAIIQIIDNLFRAFK